MLRLILIIVFIISLTDCYGTDKD